MADQATSQLAAAATLTGSELVGVTQSGASVRTTVNALLSIPPSVRQVAGTTDTPTSADVGGLIETTGASACTLTIQPDSTGNWNLQDTLEVVQIGAGQAQFVAGAGVSFIASSGAKTRAQGSPMTARRRAANQWVINGDTTT